MHKLALLMIAVLGLSAAPASPEAQREEVPKETRRKMPPQIGFEIRGIFLLESLAGKEVDLFRDNEGRILVVVFWSLREISTPRYEKELMELQKRYEKKGVSVVLVDSNYDELRAGASDPVDKIRAHVEKTKLSLPVLLDRENRVADHFGALCATHTFVLDKKRILRYSGGIDDDPKGRLEPDDRRRWLHDALEAIVDGGKPDPALTRPKGRRLSRAPK